MPEDLPKLTRTTRKSFDVFVSNANKLSLHPDDWDRYYSFIKDSYRVSSPLLGIEIKVLLADSGFPDEVTSELSRVYDHGQAIIRKYKGAIFAYPGQHPHALRNELRRQLAESAAKRKSG